MKDESENPDLLSLKVGFWSKRLDHTLTHTQTSSRLIYFVDGAVLALLYFAIQTLGSTRSVIFLLSFPTGVLAVLNILHARLISLQHYWYGGIEARLRKLLDEDQIAHTPRRRWLASTHRVYQAIHILIGLLLAGAAVIMFLWGKDTFRHFKPGVAQPNINWSRRRTESVPRLSCDVGRNKEKIR